MSSKKKTARKNKSKKQNKNKKNKVTQNKNKALFVSIIILSVLLFVEIVYGGYLIYKYISRKFDNAYIEIGTESISVTDFIRDPMFEENSTLLTDVSNIDLNKIGEYDIELSYNGEIETVKLFLVDRTKPEVKFQDITRYIDYQINADDFIIEKTDLSEMTTSVENIPEINDFGDYSITVRVTDSSNNTTEATCNLKIAWLNENYVLEFGNPLTKELLLLRPDIDGDLLDQAQLDNINNSGLGDYTITAIKDGREYKSNIKVQDTTPPTLELVDLTIYDDEKISGKDRFIKSVYDASGEVTTTMLTDMTFGTVGQQTITIRAVDKNGNTTEKSATLTIRKDTEGPVFSGLTALSVAKGTSINYESGVRASDAKEGPVGFTVDSSAVNTSVAGTYYATYTARDSKGNTTRAKRKISVNHDQADVNALVSRIAASIGNNVEEIRDYCRNKISYSASYGDGDPIWYGFNNWTGNCYVHALCFQALLRAKGYETQLIWVTNKTHYWNLVKINGQWKHMDSTPDKNHRKISIMSDAQRLSTLSGRDWDHSAWPTCN